MEDGGSAMKQGTEFNMGVDIQSMIDNLPAGLDRALLRVLQFHRGRTNAISRRDLLKALAFMGFQMKDDRPMRICINQFRKEGGEICSTGGKKSGYWLAANQAALNEWIQHASEARLKDFGKQIRAMRAAAEKRWGGYSPEKHAS